MMEIRKVALVFTLCLPALFGPGWNREAPGQAESSSAWSYSPAEYPPYDGLAWRLAQAAATAQEADRLIADSIPLPATVEALARRGSWDEAFRILNKIIDDRPGSIAAALDSMSAQLIRIRPGDRQKVGETFRQITAGARKRIPALSKADASELACRVAKFGSEAQDRVAALKAFAQEYAGTDAAGDAEIDIILSDYQIPMPERIRRLDDYIAGHPGTRACARALYQKAWDLGRNMNVRGADPTGYFMQVFDIVAQLESGKYPDCEWTRKTLSLAPGFAFQAKYADENIPRLLEAYRAFAAAHFEIDPQSPLGNGIGWMIKGMMGELYRLKGGGSADIERELIDLEKRVQDPAGPRYLRALFYMDGVDPKIPPAEKETLLGKADALLDALQTEGSGLYGRKALATQASLSYSQQDYPKARAKYRKYLESHAQSPYAWVAALRIGRCDEMLQDVKAAAESYRTAAARYASVPAASLLAHAYLARVLETLGEFDRAQTEYSRALDLWHLEEGTRCGLDPPRPRDIILDRLPADDSELARELLEERKNRIARSLREPGGGLLERGRGLLNRGKRTEAVETLEQLRKQFPKSANAAEGLVLIHKARLYDALDLAAEENPQADEPAALKQLEDLAAQPFDNSVCAAKIGMACLLWKQGKTDRAEEILSEALAGWHAHQPPPKPPSGLAKEVAELRSLVFKPTGDALFNDFRFNGPRLLPADSRAYLLVSPDVQVKQADGSPAFVTVYQDFPGHHKVLFAGGEQQAFLRDIMIKLGGTRRREPGSPMETPNQPMGASMSILKLFNRFFPAFPGPWGGWEFLSYPRVTSIHFLNKEQTSARVSITIGYAGADVIMEKADGRWHARGLTNQWVT